MPKLSASRVVMRAEGRVELKDPDVATAVATALNGRKIYGKKVETKADNLIVLFSGLDGDKADLSGELIGEAKGSATVFNARRDYPNTPLAVAWIDMNRVQGMFVVGAGDAKPSSEELTWAKKIVNAKASLDMEGPIATFGLPKRWLKFLLDSAEAPQEEASDSGGLIIGVLVLALLIAGLVFVNSNPSLMAGSPASTLTSDGRSSRGGLTESLGVVSSGTSL